LIGLFGLGDPVYAIKARDEWIGWDSNAKAARLYHVMDAYVLGAVPPYSRLLGGEAGGVDGGLQRSAQIIRETLPKPGVSYLWYKAQTALGFDHDDFRIGALVALQSAEVRQAASFRERRLHGRVGRVSRK